MISRRKLIVIFGILLIAIPIIGILIQIDYWESIDWNLVSLSPLRVSFLVATNAIYLAVLYLTKNRRKSLWLLGVIWLIYNLWVLWMIL